MCLRGLHGRFGGHGGWRRRNGMSLVWRGIGCRIDIVIVIFIVAGDISRLLGPLELGTVLGDDAVLNHLAALRIDRVSDIGIQLGAAFGIAEGALSRKRTPH